MTDLPPQPATPDDADRRSRLLGLKLRALVADHLAVGDMGDLVAAQTFHGGAGLMVDDAAWVLIDGPAARSLGGALGWAVRRGATSLHLVADSDTGLLARRAGRFDLPISVWFPEGRRLLAVPPEPLLAAPEPPETHLRLAHLIEAGGATVGVEHGVVFGEVRGLEVCRVVDQPTVGLFAELGDVAQAGAPVRAADDVEGIIERRNSDGVQLEVGVGANDREAFRMLHGEIPTVEALAGVVDTVCAHRSPEAPAHPLNRLGQERFLRWRLQQDPSLVGLSHLEPAEPPVMRPNLKDPTPCVGRDGTSGVTVVCSVGGDLDLIPYVADVQATTDEPVVVVTPKRDLLRITLDLAALLVTPVEFRSVS